MIVIRYKYKSMAEVQRIRDAEDALNAVGINFDVNMRLDDGVREWRFDHLTGDIELINIPLPLEKFIKVCKARKAGACKPANEKCGLCYKTYKLYMAHEQDGEIAENPPRIVVD